MISVFVFNMPFESREGVLKVHTDPFEKQGVSVYYSLSAAESVCTYVHVRCMPHAGEYWWFKTKKSKCVLS